MFDSIRMKLSILFATALLNIKTIWASSASIPMKLFYTVRQGFVIIAAVVALGVLTIVIPIVYLISVSVGNQLPAGGLSAGQSSTLQTLVNESRANDSDSTSNGGSALVLTTTAETVVGAGRPEMARTHPTGSLPLHDLPQQIGHIFPIFLFGGLS